jgi:hypothetical protein
MGKVFVHHSLKRAELKRLNAVMPPRSFEPIRLAIPEPDFAGKARRAAARAKAKHAQEQQAIKHGKDVDLIKTMLRSLWIESDDFCNWIHEQFNSNKELYDRTMKDEIDSLLLDMFTPGQSKLCLYCNERAVKHAGDGWAGLMLAPKDRQLEDGTMISYMLCNRCAKLSHKAIIHRAADLLVTKVRTHDKTRLLRRGEFGPLDLSYISDRMDVLLKHNKSETIGFVAYMIDLNLVANVEVFDEFA